MGSDKKEQGGVCLCTPSGENNTCGKRTKRIMKEDREVPEEVGRRRVLKTEEGVTWVWKGGGAKW